MALAGYEPGTFCTENEYRRTEQKAISIIVRRSCCCKKRRRYTGVALHSSVICRKALRAWVSKFVGAAICSENCVFL